MGDNIAKLRKRANVTQQQLADELTRLTGRDISMHMVSAWERGSRDVPAAIIPTICHVIHCTSFDLYPHSETLTDRDVQLIQSIKAMGDEEKADLFYLLHEWRGNRKALLKLDVIHAAQDKSMRYAPDKMILDGYIDAAKRGGHGLDPRAHVDLDYVKAALRQLLDDDGGDP